MEKRLFKLQRVLIRTGERAQWLRELAALPADLSGSQHPHGSSLWSPVTPAAGDPGLCCGLLGHLYMHAHIDTLIHKEEKEKILSFKF